MEEQSVGRLLGIDRHEVYLLAIHRLGEIDVRLIEQQNIG